MLLGLFVKATEKNTYFAQSMQLHLLDSYKGTDKSLARPN
jgi:hypothetical protein